MQEHLQQTEGNILEYWSVIWRRKWLIFALSTISVLVTMVVSLILPKYYKADTVILSTASESGGLASALSSLPLAGMLGSVAGVQSPSDKIMVILKSRSTAETVIRRFDLVKLFFEKYWDHEKNAWKDPEKHPLMMDAVKKLISDVTKFSKSKEGTITISVEWKDPKLTAEIANYYVFVLTEFLKDKSMNITVQTVDRAVPAERKSRPKVSQNMLLAGVTSLLLGIFLAFLLEYIKKLKTQRA